MRANCGGDVSLQVVLAQVQALQDESAARWRPSPAISLKGAVDQVQAPQRQEHLEVRANRGGTVSFEEVVAQFQALCRDESTARWGPSAVAPSA
jgi:hypothetical protein